MSAYSIRFLAGNGGTDEMALEHEAADERHAARQCDLADAERDRQETEDRADVFAELRQLDDETLIGVVDAADRLGESAPERSRPIFHRLLNMASQELLRRLDGRDGKAA